MSSLLVEETADPRTCLHPEMERLGSDDRAHFQRCVGCGSIIVTQGSHRWIIRLTDEAGPLPF